MGTLASYKEPRVYSQKHEHMTMFEVGEQRTYTEQASAGTGFQTFPGAHAMAHPPPYCPEAHNSL